MDVSHDVPLLITALRQGRHDAAGALVNLGAIAVEPLCEALRGDLADSPSCILGFRCAEVATILGKIGDARAVEALCHALEYHGPESYMVMRDAVEALGKIGDPRAVRPLCRHLGEGWDSGRLVAETLVRFGAVAVEPVCEVLLASIRDMPNPYFRCGWAAEILGRIGDRRAVEPLCKALEATDKEACYKAAHALAKIGVPAIEPLCELLRNPDSVAHKDAAEILGRIGESVYTQISGDVLAQALQDPAPRVRSWAARGFSTTKDPRGINPLLWIAAKDADGGPRLAASESLKAFSEPVAVNAFIEALAHSDTEIRRVAAMILRDVGDERAVEALRMASHGPNRQVRLAACRALARIEGDLSPYKEIALLLEDGPLAQKEQAMDKLNTLLQSSSDTISSDVLLAIIRLPTWITGGLHAPSAAGMYEAMRESFDASQLLGLAREALQRRGIALEKWPGVNGYERLSGKLE